MVFIYQKKGLGECVCNSSWRAAWLLGGTSVSVWSLSLRGEHSVFVLSDG